jgi:FlaG/FlaF family flagellin (archaellin)
MSIRGIRNKRGVSEVIGYVLLIVLVLGMSAAVYTFLKLYVPKEKPECQSDVNIIVDSYYYNAAQSILEVNVSNKGLFTVDAVYVRLGATDRKIRNSIIAALGKERVSGLVPGNITTFTTEEIGEKKPTLDLSKTSGSLEDTMTLELQAAQLQDKFGLVLCTNSVITQEIASS